MEGVEVRTGVGVGVTAGTGARARVATMGAARATAREETGAAIVGHDNQGNERKLWCTACAPRIEMDHPPRKSSYPLTERHASQPSNPFILRKKKDMFYILFYLFEFIVDLLITVHLK